MLFFAAFFSPIKNCIAALVNDDNYQSSILVYMQHEIHPVTQQLLVWRLVVMESS